MASTTAAGASNRHAAKDPFVESMAVLREILAKKQQCPPVSSPRSTSASDAQYELQLAKVQKELAEERGKVIKLQQQVEKVTSDLETATARQHEMQMELNYAHENTNEKEKQIADLQSELDEVRELNSNLQEQFINSEQENVCKIEDLHKRVSELERENGGLTQQLENIEHEYSNKIEALENHIIELDCERNAFSQQLAELKHISQQTEHEGKEAIETEANLESLTENQVVKQTNESSSLLLSKLSRLAEEYDLMQPEEGTEEEGASSTEGEKVINGNDKGGEGGDEDVERVSEVEGGSFDKEDGEKEEKEIHRSPQDENVTVLLSNDIQRDNYIHNGLDREVEENKAEQQDDQQEMETTVEEDEDEEMAEAEVSSIDSDMVDGVDEAIDDVESSGINLESEQGEMNSEDGDGEEDDDDDDDDDGEVEIIEIQDDDSSSKRTRSDDEADDEDVDESEDDDRDRKRNRLEDGTDTEEVSKEV
ncbi:hypothetical protein FisN_1Lh576 [Fistulifera solaris]|uniref:Uncharacterized protein n=1 Tax=Fistulifera solaris TaxID=1519565 RepID=A0A1Z5K1D1_FISSO|nr:hypothetical protein FisN_1Lh576 [Fistulifera solaris]|eukprot:GAX19952.1 hypothetical protein FisN_1Lh576 [Fistulifera solaris]